MKLFDFCSGSREPFLVAMRLLKVNPAPPKHVMIQGINLADAWVAARTNGSLGTGYGHYFSTIALRYGSRGSGVASGHGLDK
jgi:hypothetical protein